jgi:hypothetical protein
MAKLDASARERNAIFTRDILTSTIDSRRSNANRPLGLWLGNQRDITRIVIQAGGSLRNLDLRRARLDEAYTRYSGRSTMRREGSPLKGMATAMLKEAADHMISARMRLIMLLVLLTAIGAVMERSAASGI